MQIDGAVNNDVFGLAATGTPGGQTGTQPVSLDAIQEVQLVVSPYDVRQGGFSGGGINAVTKSGSNRVGGTAYMFARNQGLIGKIPGVVTPAIPSPGDTKVGKFTDRQGGFSLGGPIVHNKAFYFGNLDFARRNTPVGFSANGTSGQRWGVQANIQQVIDIAKSKYGFDPGGLDEFSRPNNADKVFIRTDFNVSPKNQLTVRANYVNGLAFVGFPGNTLYLMPDAYYSIADKLVSSVGQLNTTLGTTFNEFRVTYNRERNVRGDQAGNTPFPWVEVDFPDNTLVRFGTENSSQANRLNQNIMEITDDLTTLRGKHTITVGTHNEFFHFYNLFIQNLIGNYRFSSIANFQAGLAQAFSHNFSNTSNPLESAEFSVRQFGVYAGDQWRARQNFTLTYGVRADLPRFPDKPHANPLAVADFGYGTDIVPAPTMWSARAGFNWDVSNGSTNRSQLRGGAGLFTGRTPYVWLSNQYGNTGVDFTSLSVNFAAANSIPFIANPNAQPTTIPGGLTGRQTINLIDPAYKYPAVVRGNLAYDRNLGFWGLIGTGELVFSRNVKEIQYKNINYIPGGTQPDGRITYKKPDNNLNDVMLLTNTAQGSSTTVTVKIERPFRNGYHASGSYLYNHALSLNDGTASTAGSNWGNNPAGIDTNNPALTRSNYDVGHRVNLATSIPISLGKGIKSSVTLFYNGQQGRPYDQRWNGDANLDGRTNNDLLFIPASADQVNVLNGTWDQLNAYLSSDPATKDHRGQLIPRNAGRAPWSNQLDFRYGVNVPTGGKTKVELTMDIFNFLNLLNKEWGWQYFPTFPASAGLFGFGAIANGKETINLSTINSQSFQGTFTRDDLRSRWQAQWGLRVRF
jgi:hypothetical protein